jgi:predicted nucleic acid-binding protein
LIKLVITEQGSELVHELWSGVHSAASSVLVYAEGRAALASARRSDRLTQLIYTEALEKFDQAYEEVVAIGVDEQLTRAAGALAAEFALRGYDSVHLATALSLAEHDVALVTWDRDLCDAAVEAGLAVLGA